MLPRQSLDSLNVSWNLTALRGRVWRGVMMFAPTSAATTWRFRARVCMNSGTSMFSMSLLISCPRVVRVAVVEWRGCHDGRRCSFVIVSIQRACYVVASFLSLYNCSWAATVACRMASMASRVRSFPVRGVLSNHSDSSIETGGAIIGAAKPEGPTPGVMKPGGRYPGR